MVGEDLIRSNGHEATPGQPIVITITLTPRAGGYALNVGHAPELFPDTVIDAFLRAARFYEQQAWLAALSQRQAPARRLQHELGTLRSRLS